MNDPEALKDLKEAVEGMEHGTISPTFSVFRGQIMSVQGNQCRKFKFVKGEDDKAVGIILSKLKQLADDEASGNFTFTVTFTDGEIRWLYVQKNLRKDYNEDRT